MQRLQHGPILVLANEKGREGELTRLGKEIYTSYTNMNTACKVYIRAQSKKEDGQSSLFIAITTFVWMFSSFA
jgi:hypothetical protein